MNEVQGKILEHMCNYDAVCITTNGKIKSNGKAVMGAGVAKVFRDALPGIDSLLAFELRHKGNRVVLLREYNDTKILSFPTKHDWRDNSDLDLIKTSARQLMELADEWGLESVLVPRPGCSNGGLSWSVVSSALEGIVDDRVTFISL